ncbi:glycoside hydrolase [Ophiobolus disseminans]|uniref:Glycoside hydrolase n=1 Tax=Ophiobolus disseminans TaxID=1469910 RepID=A0A6A6ZG61_9PLEO|nr:glycoside hydrolase [Ophiobolus disseminans]
MISSVWMAHKPSYFVLLGFLISLCFGSSTARTTRILRSAATVRERTSLNAGWRFARFTSNPDSLSYNTLKPWILPAANDFLPKSKYDRPSGAAPGANVQYVQSSFDDKAWEQVNLPHDWAITGTFNAPGVDGGLGRLPINGVGWYRKSLSLDPALIKSGKSIFLDVDGAMAYAAVWLNGQLVGGWPFGYNSFRLDLTPYAKAGDNTLAIRLDNALDSSRWYPGAGIYRNVWLVTVDPVHVSHFGTYVTTPSVSAQMATVRLVVELENKGNRSGAVEVATEVFQLDAASRKASGNAVAKFPSTTVNLVGKTKQKVNGSVTITNPQLWGPPPTQKPNEYVAVTTLSINGTAVDTYETPFGVRSVTYDPDTGIHVNGEAVRVQGSCNHHDLGSLGAAFNTRAAERQISMLQEMGNNALRTSHNPPAPEYLDLADRLGLLVMDEIFDTWNNAKVKNDFSLIFPDWHEPDLRAFVRRDRNHPSIISWSIGNEIPEQSNANGAATTKLLQDIAHEEDPTRLVTIGMNNAGPTTGLASTIDIIGLNYQGEGRGNSDTSTFPNFKSAFPKKMIWSTESASTVSSRGTYLFPVTSKKSAVVGAGVGADPATKYVSAYDLYAPSWAASPDKVFEAQDKHPYVAGEFVWTGWDYIGEPTPYDNSSRSSYFGIIDLAGFKKDRFYLYQSRWRPDFPMAHVLPHWTWPKDRVGQVTPVHVFTSGDEAELFINDVSAGRKKKGQYDYRLRWDDVKYAPGSLRVVAYKKGAQWATGSQKTAGAAATLNLTADRTTITGDGYDLSFITVAVVDEAGITVPQASNSITFSIASGPGKIVSTDNGNPTDTTPFPSATRKAFSGLALAIVRSEPGKKGEIVVEAKASGLAGGRVVLTAA